MHICTYCGNEVNPDSHRPCCGELHFEEIPDEEVRCYDNGGETFDRYTVVYLDQPEYAGMFTALGMSENPFHPQGFCQHTMAMDGGHLGKRILFRDLPDDCRKAVLQDLN